MLLGLVFCGIFYSAFPMEVQTKLPMALVLANTVGVVAGFVAIFSPGGIGVREAISSAILAGFIPTADAVVLSLLFRLWTVVMEAIFGGFGLIIAARSRHG
jgi:uncharacterized membrane protein YbhN (UPF0104 family)